MIKLNSKGKPIEELDVEPVNFKATKQTTKKSNIDHTDYAKTPTNEAEIVAWCDAYLSCKKKGIPIYRI